MMTKAREFFDQLAQFSDRYAAHVGLESALSPWGYNTWRGGSPRGAILHYTADEDFHRVLRWFVRPKYNAQSSSNVVIADGRMAHHEECSQGLPLIASLPATVFQCRRPENPSWHATWTNDKCYGIEIVNAGELRYRDGEFVTWRRRDGSSTAWTDPWRPHDKSKVPLDRDGRWWSPYSPVQIKAAVAVLRSVQQLYGSLRRPWVLGHESVQEDKRDPGPVFPIHEIRQAVLDYPEQYLDQSWWFQNFRSAHDYTEVVRDHLLTDWARTLVGDPLVQPTAPTAWARFSARLIEWAKGADPFWTEGRIVLNLLGYYVDPTGRPGCTSAVDEERSVKIFQEMSDLVVDGQPGPKTRAALIVRLADRGLI